MNAFEIDSILPLVADQNLSGRSLDVTFACPKTGICAKARHTIDPNASPADLTKHRVKRAFFNAIRGPLASAIRSMFGYSTAGRLAGDVSSQVAYVAATPSSTMAISKQQQQDAIVSAFRTVADRFEWVDGGWAGRTAEASA